MRQWALPYSAQWWASSQGLRGRDLGEVNFKVRALTDPNLASRGPEAGRGPEADRRGADENQVHSHKGTE